MSRFDNGSSQKRIKLFPPSKRCLLIVGSCAGLLIILLTTVLLTGFRRDEIENLVNGTSELPVDQGQWLVNIYVSTEGVYKIGAADLRGAGISTEEINPADLHLYLRGQEWPMWYEGADNNFVLRFFGLESDSLYASYNVYQLIRGGSDAGGSNYPWAMVEQIDSSSVIEGDLMPYVEIRTFEQNQYYYPQASRGDLWFWQAISSSQQTEYICNLDAIEPGDAIIRLFLEGSTESVINPDHHLVVDLNTFTIIDEIWDGIGEHQVEATIKSELLVEGDNTLLIRVPGDMNVSAETVLLDQIEIEYPRSPVAINDELRITGGYGIHKLEGFGKSVLVIDVTHPYSTMASDMVILMGKEIIFSGKEDHVYYVVGKDGYHKPEHMVRATTEPDLRGKELGANYVAIGPTDLLSAIEPLLQHRTEQGLRAVPVTLNAIYDQFGYGFSEPEAIHLFLVYASQFWKPAPGYVLLVGDTTYDPRGYTTPPEANRLPTYFTPTNFGGMTASDFRFSDLDADDVPDLALGRLPARTPEEVSAVVEKIFRFERYWENNDAEPRVLSVADGQEQSFRMDAQLFIDNLLPPIQADLFAPEPGVTGANDILRGYFSEDYLLMTYFGHGSVVMWGKDRLFTVDDAESLENDHYPMVVNMTCLTGLFSHPTVVSLSESLLFNPRGGAVAVLAPTSLTLPNDQSFLSLPFAQAFSSGLHQRLGDVFLFSQRQIPGNTPGAREVMQTFLLFGDPALNIPQFWASKP